MAGIGSTLREARMRQHLDIVDLEARTKIRGKYLRALEDEEWGLLPGYPFVKGFLRTYADMLGLDGRALVDEFKRKYRDPSDIDLTAPLPSRREARRSAGDRGRDHGRDRSRDRTDRARSRGGGNGGRAPAALVVFVIAVVLAAVLYFVGSTGGPKTTATNTKTTTTNSRTTHTTTTHTRTTPAAPTRVALRLQPSGTVYVCLVGYTTPANTHGHVRLNGVILTTASREPIYHTADHFLVTFGNNSITMYVDGHRHPVPTSSSAISYSVSLGGAIHRLAAGQEPHCT